MKKNTNKLLPGEIFYHPATPPFHDPESIWLVVKHEGRNRALSLWSGDAHRNGIVLAIGGGDVYVFDNVNFLYLDRMIQPSKVPFGKFIMVNDDIIVKSQDHRPPRRVSILENRAFFSVGGAMVDEPEDGLYHMLELSLGMEGGNMIYLKELTCPGENKARLGTMREDET